MRKMVSWAGMAAMLLLLCSSAVAKDRDHHDRDVRLSGFINDYSAVNVSPPGPWEIRGTWSLTVDCRTSKAKFTADLTMERSDYWVLTSSDPSGNANSATARTPHTHHITFSDGTATFTNGVLQVTGDALVTASGAPAFNGASSKLTINVTGGTALPFSNIAMTFDLPAQGHFGTNPIHGIVRSVK